MAGDFVMVQHATARKIELRRVAAKLGIPHAHALGLCVLAWMFFDEQTADGRAEGATLEMLDEVVGLSGFSHALRDVGWLRVRDGSLEVPNFERLMGESAKKRANDAARQRRKRAKDDPESVEDEGLTFASVGGHEDVTSVSRNSRDKSVTKEEKRRVITPSPSPPSGFLLPPQESPVVATVASAAPAKAKEGDPSDADWRNCEHTLRLLGLATPGDACAKARGAGASPNDVLAVVEVWTKNPGAWTLGALHFRVGACAPGLKAETGWPPKASAASRAAPREPSAEERQAKDDFACMAIVKAGKRAGKSEEDIEREILANGLAEASRRLGWRRTTETVA